MEENTIDTEDRISMLPESIVHQILLNLLRFPEALVRMSVLSKEWFALTASFPMLEFRQHKIWSDVCKGKNNKNRLYKKGNLKYVAYATSRFCKQNVSAYTLTIVTGPLVPAEVEIIAHCLESVLKKGLRVLEIRIEYAENMPMLRLPNILLSVSGLSSLTIAECKLPSSLMVNALKFKSLKLLSLSRVQIHEGVIEYLNNSCPLLEKICLEDCYGFTRFCVYRHNTLQKVEIFCKSSLERIDIEAPNLIYFHLMNNKLGKAPYMNMASCNKLTTFCYQRSPLKSFNDFLSNFPMIENLSLELTSRCNKIKLSSHSLMRFELRSKCDLEEIDINTPYLLLFEYHGELDCFSYTPFHWMRLYHSKACMKLYLDDESDTLWFQKLRRFSDKNNIFKVLKLYVKQVDVKELKGIKWPPYELEHIY